MKKTLATLSALLFALPLFASAQNLQPLANLISSIARIVGALVPILITMALVVFFWGLVRYLWGAKEGGHDEGKSLMIWGLITLFVMVSVWGIVRLGQDALGLNPNQNVNAPQVLVPGGSSNPINPYNNAGSAQNIYNPALYGQFQIGRAHV